MAKKKIGKSKVTIYQKLQKAVSRNCNTGSKTTEQAVKKAQDTYIKDAIKKGKTKAQATSIAKKANTCKPVGKRK